MATRLLEFIMISDLPDLNFGYVEEDDFAMIILALGLSEKNW